jgi:predicted aminopeptidase
MGRFFSLLGAVCFLSSCYLTKQGYRQVGLLMDREPIATVIQDSHTSTTEKEKLEFTQQTLSYAKSQGLTVDAAYQDYVRLKGDAVSYTVQAALPTEMTLKTWWFPIVGTVPYLGYFDQQDRDEEAKQLRDDGYEIHQGAVIAYSSLGWFADPVYSSMLKRSDVDLAHLYFHELTHRTLWVKDSVEFNENLAEFIAEQLAEDFFKFLQRVPELGEYHQENADYALFRSWLQKLRKDLERNLNETRSLPPAVRVAGKEKVILLAIANKPAFKRVDFVGSGRWNNARILGAGLYSPDISRFERAAGCFRSEHPVFVVGSFLKSLEQASDKAGTGFEALEAMCHHQS